MDKFKSTNFEFQNNPSIMVSFRNLKFKIRNYSLLAIVFTFSFLLFPSLADASGLTRPANNLGLVGYWSFEDGRGATTTDFSGNGNVGTLTGNATWVNGKRGKAITLDGTGDYVQISSTSTMNLNASGTISIWFNGLAGTFGNSHAILFSTLNWDTDRNGFYLSARTNIALSWELGSSSTAQSASAGGELNPGTWYHAALTWDGSNVKTYLNGAEIDSRAQTVTPDTTVYPLRIGENAAGSSRAFPGILDEARVYNRALSATEVTALYNAGAAKLNASQVGPAPENLVLWHTFDGGYLDTSVSTDRSGNGNHGTLAANSSPDFAQPINGKVGQALRFDGVNDYVIVADSASLNMTDYISICSWVYPDTWVGHNARILQKGGDTFQYRFLSESGNFVFEVADKFLNTATLPSAGQWSHTCGVYDGATSKIYLNAAVIASTTATGTISTTTGPLYIGIKNGGAPASDVFEGRLDDLRIYNKALSAAEVERLYSSGAAKLNVSQVGSASSGLVLWHTFDGPYLNTTTSTDRSGQSNNGTLAGASGAQNKPQPTNGKIGQALNFDGTDDRTDVDSVASQITTGAVSISAWVNFPNGFTSGSGDKVVFRLGDAPSTNDVQLIFGSANGSGWSGGNDGVLRLQTVDNNATTVTVGSSARSSWDVNTWYHVTGVFDGTVGYIYVNGTQEGATSTASRLASTPATNASIGINATNDSFPFSGRLDDIRIYNTALTAAEVKKLYDAGK